MPPLITQYYDMFIMLSLFTRRRLFCHLRIRPFSRYAYLPFTDYIESSIVCFAIGGYAYCRATLMLITHLLNIAININILLLDVYDVARPFTPTCLVPLPATPAYYLFIRAILTQNITLRHYAITPYYIAEIFTMPSRMSDITLYADIVFIY